MDGAIRVLCVDDNADAAASLALLLSLGGFDVRCCFHGTDAVVEAATFRPHACVLDLNMPVMDGFELAARLREMLGPSVYLVAVSAAAGEDVKDRVVAAGFDRWFVKPADPERLLRTIAAGPAPVAAT